MRVTLITSPSFPFAVKFQVAGFKLKNEELADLKPET
jgi:hypothetical protein